MKTVAVCFAATLFASVAARGQGVFIFDNRVATAFSARFVLDSDPPDRSSVGTNFQVHLFGGPEGTPLDQLVPLDPPSTGFQGAAGTITAGYVTAVEPVVPGVGNAPATVLVRAFDGSSWELATYRFEAAYSVQLWTLPLPPAITLNYLPVGTSPLVLQAIPEPSSLLLALLGLGALVWSGRRKAGVVVPIIAMLCGSVAARGQGMLVFSNRIGTEINARFVLSSDPPGTSSVGTNFQVHLFGGPQGTPVEQLQPLDPPSTGIRGAAGTTTAGYVVGATPSVPGVPPASVATILVRVFDGPTWDTAAYRFEREYSLQVWNWNLPPNLQMGTSPLVLQPIPEPAPIGLALLGLGALVCCMRRKAGVVVVGIAVVAGSLSARGQGEFVFNNRSPHETDARFVLPTDPPRQSSVGTEFRVELFGGPEGAPLNQLVPLDPPSTEFRGAAGTALAGYTVGRTHKVPGVFILQTATILVRVFDGPNWETANYRFERAYSLELGGGSPPPPVLPLGTSPLVLQPIPEPSTLLLALLGLGAVGSVRGVGSYY